VVATGIRTGGLFDIFGSTAAGWFGARLTLKYDDRNISIMMMGTPTRKELSHHRIVDVAARTVRRAGYRGVGVADIMKEAGLTHGGFYAHFESRDAMLVEAMQRAGQDNLVSVSDGMERRLRQGGTRFRALIETYLHDTHIERTEDGCVIAALASEMTRQHEAVLDEARRRIAAMVDLVRAALPSGAADCEAVVVASTMIGALQLARTLGAKAGRDVLAQTRRSLIERYDHIDHR
jgi:TetR/AcrR family transcriptional regulator, transcriptional repressor for nem operon